MEKQRHPYALSLKPDKVGPFENSHENLQCGISVSKGISKRLKHLADLVAFDTAADIGCDHGLLTAYLLKEGIIARAVASDLKPGPLRAAAATFRIWGVCADLRLGNGLEPLSPGEVRTCIIAGMGGMTIIDILKNRPETAMSFEQLILSPERDSGALRRYLHVLGFYICKESLIEEKRRFYLAIDARPGHEPPYDPAGYMFGQYLIRTKDPVLRRFLERERRKTEELMAAFSDKPCPDHILSAHSTIIAAQNMY